MLPPRGNIACDPPQALSENRRIDEENESEA